MVRVHLGLPVDLVYKNKVKKLPTIKYGGVAQLGEHLPCKQGVMGSNPIISTTHRNVQNSWLHSFKESNMLIENRIEKKETNR